MPIQQSETILQCNQLSWTNETPANAENKAPSSAALLTKTSKTACRCIKTQSVCSYWQPQMHRGVCECVWVCLVACKQMHLLSIKVWNSSANVDNSTTKLTKIYSNALYCTIVVVFVLVVLFKSLYTHIITYIPQPERKCRNSAGNRKSWLCNRYESTYI